MRFQLTRPVWGEPVAVRPVRVNRKISTHSPRVGRTLTATEKRAETANFNSLAPCGANRDMCAEIVAPLHFNSLAPCGANPAARLNAARHGKFQLTRPVWGEPKYR